MNPLSSISSLSPSSDGYMRAVAMVVGPGKDDGCPSGRFPIVALSNASKASSEEAVGQHHSPRRENMNPGSAQQLVSAERRAVRARFRWCEIGGGDFAQAALDARRSQSRLHRPVFWGRVRTGALKHTLVLQLPKPAHRNPLVATNDRT